MGYGQIYVLYEAGCQILPDGDDGGFAAKVGRREKLWGMSTINSLVLATHALSVTTTICET